MPNPPVQLILDHIAVACTSLDKGVSHVEELLGVPLQAGGNHDHFGTHNALLALEDGLYLEVIAVNPASPPLPYPRWFNLDEFSGEPRLTNWIVRTQNLQAALSTIDLDLGAPIPLTRGDLKWQMAVPSTGLLPFNNLHPALIEWEGAAHPKNVLTPKGCRLEMLTIMHPEARSLQAVLAPLFNDERVVIAEGPAPSLAALIDTPNGMRTL